MKENISWYRRSLAPRFVFVPFWIMRLCLVPLGRRRNQHSPNRTTKLCIEAGVRGWESIEFKELYASACEYLSPDCIQKVVIDKNSTYLSQLRKVINEIEPTHYLYDPRTGSQQWITAMREAFCVAFLFHIKGIVSVVLLTDLSVRTHRAQSAVVTAKRGVVVNFNAPKEIAPIFPHRRLIGPSLMPFSKTTLISLTELASHRLENDPLRAHFVGSLYEPRTSILATISVGLKERGFNLEIHGRKNGGPRIPDQEYWSQIINSPIIITTAIQPTSTEYSKKLDWTWLPQLTYRYLEVMACGTLLVAPEVPGLRRYFIPGVHFVAFNSTDDAIEQIAYYLTNVEERQAIARQGKEKASALIFAYSFWTGIEVALESDSLT